ncbi:MAG: iron ABC transporter permease [Anaerolineae bacterium]|nr:iron ABC transporter permease [Anaerolineae bacterium]
MALLALAAIPSLFLLVFYFYPLGSILSLSLAPGGQLSLRSIATLTGTTYYLRMLWFTTWQALLSTFLTVVLALPGAYAMARYTFPGKSLLQALSTVPFVLPTIVVTLAFIAFLGPRGWLNLVLMRLMALDEPPLDLRYTLGAILVAHIFYNYSLVLRLVSTFWSHVDPQLADAARMLGANRWQAFRDVTLPLLLPAIGASSTLVFIFCFTSFGVILILGGPRFATLEVEIFRQTVQFLNLPLAILLSFVQIVLMLAMLTIYVRLQGRVSVPILLRSQGVTQKRPQTAREWLFLALAVAPIAAMVLPLYALLQSSLTSDGILSIEFYRDLFRNTQGSVFYVPPIEAVRNSLGFATATMVLSVVLGLMVSAVLASRDTQFRSLLRFLDSIFMLPLGTSAVTLGLGFIIALDHPPINLRASPAIIVVAHTLVALPFVVRSVLPALQSIQPQLREAAALLGASPWRVWREVDLPIVARAVVVGAVFAFTVSMGEFGATSLISRPELPTMPIAIYRFLGRPGVSNYGQALAMSSLLMGVCTLGFLLIERFRIGEIGEF